MLLPSGHANTRCSVCRFDPGRIFDDRGNRMTPSHVRKRSVKYRYYLSSALLQGQNLARSIGATADLRK
jgi:site-specific DNA recombinase